MEIGILGFPKSGKTTVFNALTGQSAETSAFASGKTEPNLAMVNVPDERLDKLGDLFKPKKHTPATVRYIDLAGIAPKAGETGEGLGESQMHAIANCDALAAVIRGFENAEGAKPDVAAEAENILLEMTLGDLKKVDTRLERLAKSKNKVAGAEGAKLAIEQSALEKLKPLLEDNRPIREGDLTADEQKSLRGFQFLTGKPLLIIVNASEEALAAGAADPSAGIQALAARPGVRVTWIAARAESDIAQMPEEERAVFLEEYGISEAASRRIIRLSYDLLGMISFFTVGPDECRAWTVRQGAQAPEAAGVIHSDLQRGFIRAEVCRWDDLLEAGTFAELKKKGKFRLEGKEYVAQDGDIMNVLFNV